MATKKATKKKTTKASTTRAKKSARKLKVSDLQTATADSVKALVAKSALKRPGIWVGIWPDKARLKKLGLDPDGLASSIAKGVSDATGTRVKPVTSADGNEVFVGYIQPSIKKV